MFSRIPFRVYIWAALIALAAFVAFNFLQDIFAGEEGRVRKFIKSGKRAIETGNMITVSDMVSAGYRDKYGNDYSSLIYAIRTFLSSYKSVLIHIEQMQIQLNDSKTEADLEITALILGQLEDGGSKKILDNLAGEKDRFRLKLIKEENKWRLLEVEFLEGTTIGGHEISRLPKTPVSQARYWI